MTKVLSHQAHRIIEHIMPKLGNDETLETIQELYDAAIYLRYKGPIEGKNFICNYIFHQQNNKFEE